MKEVLYLGTDPTNYEKEGKVTHFPVIEICAREKNSPEMKRALDDLPEYTHIIFTSKNAVKIFAGLCAVKDLIGKQILAVGKMTARALEEIGLPATHIAQEQTQEGLIELIKSLYIEREKAYLLLPHSSISRPVLAHFLQRRGLRHQTLILYDTKTREVEKLPSLDSFDEILFTSPSTVQGFIDLYGALPKGKTLTPIGPVTKQALEKRS